MHKNILSRKIILVALIAIATTLISQPAKAYKLTFYYDPDTGNLSFDTANTRTGELILYNLRIHPRRDAIQFRVENFIPLSNSTLMNADEGNLQEITLGSTIKGLFTLGNVLPIGISEQVWTSMFSNYSGGFNEEFHSEIYYLSGTGQPFDDPIEYIYGAPDGEFDNRWDLVDPDKLDWATEASLIYRQQSGEVLLDTRGTDGGHISGFLLRSDGEFVYENFTPPWDSPNQTNDVNRIDLLGDAVEPGLYSLGNILETGLTQSEYESLFTTADFWGRAGFVGELDLETENQSFSLVFVPIPEPAAVTLFTLAALLITTSRKKINRYK